jgi:hypothetical protein
MKPNDIVFYSIGVERPITPDEPLRPLAAVMDPIGEGAPQVRKRE